MKYVFIPKIKDFKQEKNIIISSVQPLSETNSSWILVDEDGFQKIIKKSAYEIFTENKLNEA